MSERPATYLARVNPDQPLIRNCHFAFRCHQKWLSLERTADPRVRHCHECARQVVLCQKDADLLAALQANHCVAIDSGDAREANHLIGDLRP